MTEKAPNLPSPLVYPLNDNQRSVKLHSEVMSRPTDLTRNLLYQEELNLGQYHRREFKEWGIEPFVSDLPSHIASKTCLGTPQGKVHFLSASFSPRWTK